MATGEPDAAPPPVPLETWGEARGPRLFCRATAVAVGARGALFVGAPGSGKSALALALMAHGARLVSDDGVWVEPDGAGGLTLLRPETAPPLVEARGVGLLRAGPIAVSAPLVLAVDLSTAEPDRLPPRRLVAWAGGVAELILGAGAPTLWADLLHMLREGRGVPGPDG